MKVSGFAFGPRRCGARPHGNQLITTDGHDLLNTIVIVIAIQPANTGESSKSLSTNPHLRRVAPGGRVLAQCCPPTTG
ncbi:hypothetical protein ZHAS_00012429 [Anopheles sinensis]|uniref:Uncharacterized protein n=1 Tax=Anopheles sinensis TaxID=74873 RepID=A0A084W2V6_ANOSI|nr:hypothetical protein ZHAS_00012429 [Anopheles sinensis]